ncbi:MAG: glycosyltransferase family 2 protein [Candidatus Omnitrophica bacterium]|nr:glycosyltransferase family 2 protein [Candidatus Omnitrophota bacterium]MDD5653711.1 glycosyltransferase family 2 protein [Candidatus Omnitrophota bacterium]
MKDAYPLVSFNIATYNSAHTLAKCLDSLKAQTYKNFEVIIMDSNSKDKTLQIAKAFGAKIVFAPTLATARKAGADASRGEYIFVVDSDQVLEPDVAERCVVACEKEGFDGVTLFERSLITKNTFVERVIAYDKEIFHSLHDDDPIKGTAIPRFFRASFFKRVEFEKNPPITFEHTIIHQKIVQMGAKIKFIDAYIWHHETTTIREVARKFYRYGYYYWPAYKFNKELAIHHSLPRRTYFHYRALKNPLLFVGLFYVYFVKAVSALIGAYAYTLNFYDRE